MERSNPIKVTDFRADAAQATLLGLWLRLGFAGFGTAAAGVAALFEQGTPSGLAPLLLAGGTACAALAWKRLRPLLAEPDATGGTTDARRSRAVNEAGHAHPAASARAV